MSDQLIGQVQHAIPASSVQSSIPKSTITKRNAKTKKGLGAKKVGGLGGKKVTKIDFEKLEKNAEEEDKMKHRLSVSSGTSDGVKAKIEESGVESMRLAYQDLSVKEKQNNLKLSKMDEQKKQQAQRLGMGMGKTEGVSHSLDMVTISQVDPERTSRRGRYEDKEDIFYDAFSSKSRRHRWGDDSDDDDDGNDFSYSTNKISSKNGAPPTYTITPIADGHHADTSVLMSAMTNEPKNNRHRSVRKPIGTENEDIVDKYKNANAISSDMLFGASKSQFSDEQQLRKFDGQHAISSDQYYNRSQSSRSDRSNHLGDIKDGVKEGVRSVAGKLSNMASGLANTIQDRYG